MGLLGTEYDDPKTQGLLTLGLGLLNSRGNFGQSLASAGQQAMGAVSQARQAQQQREMFAQQQQQAAIQQQMAQLQLQQAQAAQQRQEQLQALARQSARSPQQMAMQANGGPTVAAAQAIPNTAPGFDLKGYIGGLWGIDPNQAIAFEAATRKDDAPLSVKEGETLLDRRTMKPLFSNPKNDAPPSVREYQFGQKSPEFNAWLERQNSAKGTKVQVDAGQRFENAYSTAQGKSFSDTMETINKAGFNAPAQIRKLERMEQLLQNVDGGKLAPLGKEVASIANSVGIKIDPKLGNKEAAESLSRELAGGLRQPGTGPMTDKDFDNFLTQIPDLSKSAEGRKQITQTMRAALNRDMELAKMAREYERRTGRLDSGFMDEAARFIAANPVVGNMPGWQGVDLGDGFTVRKK